MSAGGWVAIHRQLADHPIWTQERFTRGQAWVDLILLASYADHVSLRGTEALTVTRGQVLTSQVRLAARWGWNRKTVRGFLEALKAAAMADIETSRATDTGYTIITLRNFKRFQDIANRPADIENGTALDIRTDIERTSDGHRVPTINKGNKGNNIVDASTSTPALKGNSQRKPRKTHPETGALLKEFQDRFEGKWSTRYVSTYGRDQRLLSELLNAAGPEDVRHRMRLFFENGTRRTRDLGDYGVPAFRSAWNELGVLVARGDL
jgi:hypothetical protein